MTLSRGNGIKCEVKELGATELRREVGKRQSRNDVRELNPCGRDVEALLVRRASVTRMGISITAFFREFYWDGSLIFPGTAVCGLAEEGSVW